MSESYSFEVPGRFTVGAIGEPGQRLFYFQVFADGTEVALKCEKQQAQALADHLATLVAPLTDPEAAAPAPADALPPAELAWPVGGISIGLDEEQRRVLLVFEELVVDEEGNVLDGDAAQLRVRLTVEQVQAFTAQVEVLVAGSRPICRLCEQPMDPSGHACPRLN